MDAETNTIAPAGPASGEATASIAEMAELDFTPWLKGEDQFVPPSNAAWMKFGEKELPPMRLAVLTMQKTKAELVQMWGGDDDKMLQALVDDWSRGAEFFAELGKVALMLESARARMLVAAATYVQQELAR